MLSFPRAAFVFIHKSTGNHHSGKNAGMQRTARPTGGFPGDGTAVCITTSAPRGNEENTKNNLC